jgi:GT2 family glycosyltransferase
MRHTSSPREIDKPGKTVKSTKKARTAPQKKGKKAPALAPRIAWIIVTTARVQPLTDTLIESLVKLEIDRLSIYQVKNKEGRDGYAHGVNIGIREALRDNPDIIIISNPDIHVGTHFARHFLDVARHFDVWGYAMKQQKTHYYGGVIDQWRLSGGLDAKKPSKRYASVDFISGSLMGFRPAVVRELGVWDERYGMYYEDVDFCARARRAGWRVGIDANCQYDHFETSSQAPYRDKKALQLALSRLRYFLQYAQVRHIIYEAMRAPLTIWEYRFLLARYGWPWLRRNGLHSAARMVRLLQSRNENRN